MQEVEGRLQIHFEYAFNIVTHYIRFLKTFNSWKLKHRYKSYHTERD